ncbi:MAG: FecR domain-containing protein, partial [Pseudomonadota bacterium]
MLRIFLLLLVLGHFTYLKVFACAKVALNIGHVVDQDGVRLKTGANLEKGTDITTGPSSLVKLILIDDSIIDLGSSSHLKLTACEGKNWETRINLDLKKGSIRALVNKAPRKKREVFELKTETSVLAVRGTEFFVSWQENKAGQVVEQIGVSEGRVEVRSLFDDASKPITLTTGTEFVAEGRIEKVRGEIKVEATSPPRVDQFSGDEQRQAELNRIN